MGMSRRAPTFTEGSSPDVLVDDRRADTERGRGFFDGHEELGPFGPPSAHERPFLASGAGSCLLFLLVAHGEDRDRRYSVPT